MHLYPPIMPYLAVHDAASAIDFAVAAFGAKVAGQVPRPDGRVMHAELKLNGGVVMLADSTPEHGFTAPNPGERTPVGLMLAWPSEEEVDERFARALAAGAHAETEPHDAAWGARFAGVIDPSGHRWWLYAMKAG